MPTKENNIPSLPMFMQYKADSTALAAAQHIQQQTSPNVPRIPSRNLISLIAAKIMGMSDEERIRHFGTEDVKTCIYTVTSQFNDEGALVPGNITFRKAPEKYGFHEIPMDSAKTGDLIQLTNNYDSQPFHSTLMVGRDSNGVPHVGYSRGRTTQYFEDNEGNVKPTMVKDTVLTAFDINPDDIYSNTPTAFRYEGSPQKKVEWMKEYTKKYNQPILLDVKTPMTTHEEVPDALRVVKPAVIKDKGGHIIRKKWARNQ